MPTLRELLEDPDFKAASPGVRLQAFEHVASGDADWQNASADLKAGIRASVTQPSSPHVSLPSIEEKSFRDWYSAAAGRTGIDPDPDKPEHRYDYRAAYLAKALPDSSGHWPSQFKDDNHPNRFVTIDGRLWDTKNDRPASVSETAAARLPGTVEGPLPETQSPSFADRGPASAAIAGIPAAMQRGGEALKSLVVNAPGRIADFLKKPGPAVMEALSGRESPVADVGREALDVAGGAFAPLRPLNPAFAPSIAAKGPLELGARAFGASPETAGTVADVGQQLIEGLGGAGAARSIQTGKLPLGRNPVSSLVRQAVGAPEESTAMEELAASRKPRPAAPPSEESEAVAKAVGAGDELPGPAPAAAAAPTAAEAPSVRITWDTGPETTKLATQSGQSIVRVPIDELLGAARESAEAPGRFRQQVGDTDKLTRAQRFVVHAQEAGIPVKLPQLSIDNKGGLSIDDGLHRTVVARDLGYRTIPVRISSAQLGELEQMGVRFQPVEAYNAADAGRAAASEGLAQAGREVAGAEAGPAGAGNESGRRVREAGLPGAVRGGAPAAPGAPQAPEELAAPRAPSTAPKPSIPPEGFSTPETQGPLPKYAGSVNLTRINTSEDVKRAITEAAAQVPKRAPVSNEELRAAAEKLGFTVDDAEKFAAQTSAQRAKWLATRDVHTALEERYVAARDAWRAEATPANFEALKAAQANQLRGFAAAQEVASQAGAALQSFRYGSEANIGSQAKRAIDQLLVQVQAKGKLSEDVTRRLASLNLEDPEAVNRFLRVLSTKKATFQDKFLEAWTAGLLTGPKTHIANTLGNTLASALKVPEQVATATIDAGRAVLSGAPRERFFGEATRGVVGLVGGLQDATKVFLKTFVTELPKDASTKIEIAARGPAIGGTLGRVVRLPFSFLSAADDFFKVLITRSSTYSLAYREAAQKGLKGKALLEEADRLVTTPTAEMLAGAKEEALYRTFQKPLGPVGQKVLELREVDKSGLLRFFFPFVRTPINVGKFSLERTGPLNLISIATRAAKGEAFRGGALSEELAKVAIGTGISGVVAAYALDGKVTGGGPKEANQRKALLATGWQPYSIKIGDAWYSYSRLEPFSTAIGTTADAVELSEASTEQDASQLRAKAALAFAKNITSKTFLQGLSSMINALQDPTRYGESFIGQMAGSLVPAGAAAVARAGDETLRETGSVADSVKARIPGQREELPPKRDVFGEPIAAAGTFWTRFLSPVDVSAPRGGPFEHLLVDLGASVGPVRDTVVLKGPGGSERNVKLTPEQYDRLQVLSGELVKKAADKLLERHKRWEGLPRETQLRLLHAVIDEGRAAGRIKFFREAGYRDLLDQGAPKKPR